MKTQEETRIPQDRLWLSYPEAVILSGLSRTTIWRITKSGAVQTARYGRAVRINRRSLEEWLEAGGRQ